MWSTYYVSGPGTALATGGIAAHVYVTGGGGTVNWIGVGGQVRSAVFTPRGISSMSALGLAPLSTPGTTDPATGIASVARRANDAADVVWLGLVGPAQTEKLVAAQMHNDSAGAGAMWSGYMLPKRSGR